MTPQILSVTNEVAAEIAERAPADFDTYIRSYLGKQLGHEIAKAIPHEVSRPHIGGQPPSWDPYRYRLEVVVFSREGWMQYRDDQRIFREAAMEQARIEGYAEGVAATAARINAAFSTFIKEAI